MASRGPLGIQTECFVLLFMSFGICGMFEFARHFPQSVAMQQEVWLAVSSETEITRLGELGVGKVFNVIGPLLAPQESEKRTKSGFIDPTPGLRDPCILEAEDLGEGCCLE